MSGGTLYYSVGYYPWGILLGSNIIRGISRGWSLVGQNPSMFLHRYFWVLLLSLGDTCSIASCRTNETSWEIRPLAYSSTLTLRALIPLPWRYLRRIHHLRRCALTLYRSSKFSNENGLFLIDISTIGSFWVLIYDTSIDRKLLSCVSFLKILNQLAVHKIGR